MNQSQIPLSAFISPDGDNKALIERLFQQVFDILFNHLQTADTRSPLPQIRSFPILTKIPDQPLSESQLLEQLQTILTYSINAAHPAFVALCSENLRHGSF
ncbi:MAG: hypothetical protein AAGF26_11645 [Cyanobacteria bacterium P01_G01_bin.49]